MSNKRVSEADILARHFGAARERIAATRHALVPVPVPVPVPTLHDPTRVLPAARQRPGHPETRLVRNALEG